MKELNGCVDQMRLMGAADDITQALGGMYLSPNDAKERAGNLVQALLAGANKEDLWNMLAPKYDRTGRMVWVGVSFDARANAVYEVLRAWTVATSSTAIKAVTRLTWYCGMTREEAVAYVENYRRAA